MSREPAATPKRLWQTLLRWVQGDQWLVLVLALAVFLLAITLYQRETVPPTLVYDVERGIVWQTRQATRDNLALFQELGFQQAVAYAVHAAPFELAAEDHGAYLEANFSPEARQTMHEARRLFALPHELQGSRAKLTLNREIHWLRQASNGGWYFEASFTQRLPVGGQRDKLRVFLAKGRGVWVKPSANNPHFIKWQQFQIKEMRPEVLQ